MKKMKSESGVSELIGAILLVSLVVMLMMVVTTVIISQPRPEKVPELSVSISINATGPNDTGPYIINVTHMGGDELKEGEYSVLINNKVVLRNGPEWSINDPVRSITTTEVKPLNIEVYYLGPSTQVLLAKSYIQ
jgi:hypothetical protein